ncbi:alpha-L-rhamnosidase C-terminal domain-containing protein [Spirosoma foliorum]|uniref:alpha-L-rhamnosidase C-terminal domain-containing protein n=1 Tax=Spirosoma foliorum TaxID=2710596 RepID=UPI001F0A219D|nr:alpha-L-rhamnosidase C-terminal domain-containing protein [Spirosoma foliorum]
MRAPWLWENLNKTDQQRLVKALKTTRQFKPMFSNRLLLSAMTEAWDTKYKPNQDWNHAWGAAPANIIVRKLMGVEALTPAFETVQIKPQPDTLRQASLQLATLRGPILVAFNNTPERFQLHATLPANSTGVIYLPRKKAKSQVWQNGAVVKAVAEGNFWKITGVGAGKHEWEVK